MSQDPIADTKSKLDDLEQRIHAARSSLGARGDLNDEAQREWKAMVEKHAEIRRELDAHPDHPAGVTEGIRFDVDILRTSFETWVARSSATSTSKRALTRGGHLHQAKKIRRSISRPPYRYR